MSSTTLSGGSPPSDSPRSIEPRVGWKRRPIAPGGRDLGAEQVAAVAREDVVVVGAGRAAAQREPAETGRRGGVYGLFVDARPTRVQMHVSHSNSVASCARPRKIHW